MKKNPALIGLLITIGLTILCYAVYILFLEKKDSYLIANPSKEALQILIDDQNYYVAPQQVTEIKLKSGLHSIKFDYEGKTIDTVFDVKYYNGLINPTRSDYYIFTRPYGAARNRDSLFTSQTLTIDEKVYFGNIKHSNELYIQGFYINLDQDYPNFYFKKDLPTDVSKVFSKDEFKQFYFENYE